jgi:hypothetical protein
LTPCNLRTSCHQSESVPGNRLATPPEGQEIVKFLALCCGVKRASLECPNNQSTSGPSMTTRKPEWKYIKGLVSGLNLRFGQSFHQSRLRIPAVTARRQFTLAALSPCGDIGTVYAKSSKQKNYYFQEQARQSLWRCRTPANQGFFRQKFHCCAGCVIFPPL